MHQANRVQALHQASVAMTEGNGYTYPSDVGGDVLEATKGILFLGIPHRGSDLGWIGYLVYALCGPDPWFLKRLPFRTALKPRADLIVGLRTDAHKLTESTENLFGYVRTCRDVRKPVHFRSFYKTRELLVCIVR
jgi:hypothetical protein